MPSASETVSGFYALLAEGRFEEAFAFVDPNAVIREPRDLPFGGDYRGMAEISQLLARMGAVIDMGIAQHTIMDGHETFAVKLKSRFTPRAGGEPLELDILELITVRNDKIVEIDVWHKTPSVVAAIWPA